MSIATSAAKLAEAIARKRSAVEAQAAELAELERQAAWAAGEERRNRLAALRAEAEPYLDGADQDAIRAAATAVVDAIAELRSAITARNIRLHGLRGRAQAEGVHPSPGTGFVGSPADAGVALEVNDGIRLGPWRCKPADEEHFVAAAVAGNLDRIDAMLGALDINEHARKLATSSNQIGTGTRYWKSRTTRDILPMTADPTGAAIADLYEVGAIDWLTYVWGTDLADLPADVRARALADVGLGEDLQPLPA